MLPNQVSVLTHMGLLSSVAFTKLNSRTPKSFIKIIGIGKKNNQEKRAIENVVTTIDGEIPVLRGLHKDHKEGRKMRPLVNGNVGPLRNLSDILSDILDHYMEELQEMFVKAQKNY